MVFLGDTLGLTLLRHGLTKENIEKKYIGWMDASLSALGKKELQNKVGYPTGDYYVSSDLKRAIETMEIIYPHQPYEVSRLLRELSFGEFEGKTYEQLKENKAYRHWIDHLERVQAPAGESMQDLQKRVDQQLQVVLQKAKEKQYSNVVFVTHGGVIRHILSSYADSTVPFWEWKVPHGSAVQTNWKKQKEEWVCTSYQVVPLMEKENM